MSFSPVSERLAEIQPFYVMSLLARARELEAQGRNIVHMEIGEPDFTTIDSITNAGIKALSDGRTHYTPAAGLPELRETIAGFYASHYSVNIDPSRIIVTPGSSGALQLVMGLLLDNTRRILLTDPGYPCNRNIARFLGARVTDVPVSASNGFQLSAEDIDTYWQEDTVAALIASPSNPTGTTLGLDDLSGLVNAISSKQGYLICDEIYHGLEYGERRLPTAADLGENVFVINSFSKYFGMTGWRIGWLISPENLVSDLNKLAQNLFLAASTPAQWAAIEAFSPVSMQQLEQRKQI